MRKIFFDILLAVLLFCPFASNAEGVRFSYWAIYNVLDNNLADIALDKNTFVSLLLSRTNYDYSNDVSLADFISACKGAAPSLQSVDKNCKDFAIKVVEENNRLYGIINSELYKYVSSGVSPDKNSIRAETWDGKYYVAKILIPTNLIGNEEVNSVLNEFAVFDTASDRVVCVFRNSNDAESACFSPDETAQAFLYSNNGTSESLRYVKVSNASETKSMLNIILSRKPAPFFPVGDEVLKIKMLWKNYDSFFQE